MGCWGMKTNPESERKGRGRVPATKINSGSKGQDKNSLLKIVPLGFGSSKLFFQTKERGQIFTLVPTKEKMGTSENFHRTVGIGGDGLEQNKNCGGNVGRNRSRVNHLVKKMKGHGIKATQEINVVSHESIQSPTG